MKKRLLSTLLALCMVLALLPGTAWAATVQSGKCGDNATWVLDSDGTLTVKGTGEISDYDTKFPPWDDYYIKKVVIQDGITSIGYAAFRRCSMVSISIPRSVQSIGGHAFEACRSLTSIVIPQGVRYFGGAAFERCSALTSILLPDSIESISGFSGCRSLKNVYYAGTDMQWASIEMDDASSSVLKASGVKVTFDYTGSTIPSASCTVYFNPNSSSASVSPTSKTVMPGAEYGDLPTPVRAGYTFKGWYTKSVGGVRVYSTTTVGSTSSHTLYAYWSKNTASNYTVLFNGGGGTPTYQTKTVTNGGTYGTLPQVSRTGYTFKGWYTKSSGGTRVWSSDTVRLSGDQTLYAQWTKNQTGTASGSVKVTFDANGGKVTTTTKNVTRGKAYGALPTPTRTGYKFNGWYTNKSGGTKITSSTTVTTTYSTQKLTAHWTKTDRMFCVFFDPNGGEPVFRDSQKITTGSRYRSLPTPVRDGYHFDGWWTKASGGTRVTENTRITQTKSHYIYAHWTTRSVQVTNTVTGNWKVVIPAYYETPLYMSATGATWPSFLPEKSSYRTISCTKKATLSNGTVRYCGKFTNGEYWFTYTDEMDV